MSALDGYASEDDLASELQVHPKTIERWRATGEGPPHTKIGRKVFYKRTSLDAWLAKREHKAA
jgi:Helix-turn-helix domain